MSRTLLDDLLSPDGTRRPRRARAAAHRGRNATVLGIGLVLVALNLRIGVASVGPVLTSIRDDLGLSAPAASLLTTIPVIAFGAFAFLAPVLTRRLGMYRLLGLAMAALAAGIVLRLQPSLVSLFAGTVIVGAAIAIANVVMPALIKRDFPHRIGPWMGLYSTMIFLSAAIADGLTVPLLPVVGGHWRRALALWAIPAVVAFLVWIPQLFRAPGQPGQAPAAAGVPAAAAEPSFRALLTDPVALALTAYMAIQCTGYYVTLTWLPTLLQDHGMAPHTAGWMLSYSAFPGIAAALVSPVLARRIRPTWVPIAVSVILYGAAYAGLAVAPLRATYLWMTLLGLGQGASISLALSYIAWRSPDVRHTAHVSTMTQGFGYLLASLGPIGIGAIHAASGSWTVPLIVLTALLVLQLIAGALASRERHVLTGRAGRVLALSETTGSQPTESDQLRSNEPRPDDLWFDELRFDEPKSSEPRFEELRFDEPRSGEPRFEELRFAEPKSNEPIPDDPISDAAVSGDPISDESIAHEPIFHELIADRPISDDLASDGPWPNDLGSADLRSEEPESDEPRPDELMSKAPESGAPRPDEAESDASESGEPRPDDLVSDDPESVEPRSDDLAPDDAEPDEPISDHPASGDPGTDGPASDEAVEGPWENVVNQWLSQPNPALPRPYAPQNQATTGSEQHVG
jgi:MFS transporter, CP family, cyanate transporter